MTTILGKAVATAEQMAEYLLSRNPNPKINIPVLAFCRLYLYIGALEGVRGDVLFAQSCKETGNFTFPATVKEDQNNYAGLGTTDANTPGAIFPDEATGILAQAQHAKGYDGTPLNYDCVDPRYELLVKYGKVGTAKHWEELGGTWAVPGYDVNKYASLEEANAAHDSYGWQIINILNRFVPVENEKEEGKDEETMSNSPLVDYVKISPNSTNPRKDTIKKITIHHMAGNLTVERCGEVFAPKTRKASSNYAIGSDGRVGMYVEEKNRSWCSSNAGNDNQAITIEVANDGGAPDWHVSDAALAKLIDLCVDICKRNGIAKLNFTGDKSGNLTMHKYFTATVCPGAYLESKFPYIADEVNKRLGNASQTASQAGKVLYKVQVGAYGKKANAENVKAKLKKAGFDALVVMVGNLYKVQTGAFSVKANAEALQKKVKAAGFEAIIVKS